jgi:hypothetical protein
MQQLILQDLQASLGVALTEQLDNIFWQQAGAPNAQVHAAILRGLPIQTCVFQEILESLPAISPGPVSMTAQPIHPATLVRNSLIKTPGADCCCSNQAFHPSRAEMGQQEGPENPRTTILGMKHWHLPQAVCS